MLRHSRFQSRRGNARTMSLAMLLAMGFFVLLIVGLVGLYSCYIHVEEKHVAILVAKTGADIQNGDEVAPDETFKGVQITMLKEGHYFKNPYYWDWEIHEHFEVPEEKLGVRIRLRGDDLPYGEFLAPEENQKGIDPIVLRPGRYQINHYAEKIELYDPVVVPPGFKGVVTNLAGPLPEDPNTLVAPAAVDDVEFRGVQPVTLNEGRYLFNPYVKRIDLVDCRVQTFYLAKLSDMGFPSKDGFWVSLDGIVRFRVMPERAAEVFVTYNDEYNKAGDQDPIDDEIIAKIILPNSRSFCRLEGSKSLGREFIQGETRTQFQANFQAAMETACGEVGIQIEQALITKIVPPERIALPVREREIAKQQEKQYQQQIIQQESEKNLAIELTMVKRKEALVKADQEIVRVTTEALQEQEVAVTKANENLGVSRFKLEAAKDKSAAIQFRGQAAADVVKFENEAEAAGWKNAVVAFDGDGRQFAQFVLYQKISSAYQNIMVNTADSPIMRVFEAFVSPSAKTPSE